MTRANRGVGATIGSPKRAMAAFLLRSSAAVVMLGFVLFLSACGAAPVAQNWPGLTLAGNTIYVISGNPQQVIMLDVETGLQKGSFVPQGEHRGTLYWSPVTEGNGTAFVGFAEEAAKTAGLYAFDPASGQELWSVPVKSLILPAPTYADGVVYFGSSDGLVYAVDVEAHSIRPGWPFEAEDAIWASPLVVEGKVYVASMDHNLYCLDAETGSEIWRRKVGGAVAAQPTLDAARGWLYVGAFDGKVYAIQADSGEIVDGFSFQAGGWMWSEPLLAHDRVYATSLNGKLYALDPATGAQVPPYPYDATAISGEDGALRAAPILAGESIVVAAESGHVIALQEAQQRWSWPSGVPQASILTTPVLARDKLYVVLMDGQVMSLDAATGAQGWVFSPPKAE